jgi:acetyl-CoA carboxylase biotin carboxyl carrier protein
MTLCADDIAGLAAALAESGLAELHLTGPATDVHLVRSRADEIDRVVPPSPPALITASGAGIFLTCHPLHTAPLAAPDRFVRAGEMVALLRIGLVLRPVTAPTAGHIGAPLAEPGRLVGYGTKLFQLHPEQSETQA